MKNGKKSAGLILFSIIAAIVVASWIIVATPMLKNNSVAFEDIREYLGEDAYVKNIGDKLSEPIISSDFLEYKIVNQNGNVLEIESYYITRDIITGETIYENYNTYYVDSSTRKHVDHDESYFIFPTNVQKQNYLLFDPNMEVLATFVFEGTKQIGDLDVYEFSCESMGDDFSQAWPEFLPDIVYADQTCKTSIEPVTGKTLEFAITWDMYVIKDGKHVSVERGKAETTEFSERILMQSASDTKQLFYIYDYVVPTFLIIVLTSIFFAILSINKSREKGRIIIKQLEEMQRTEKMTTIGHLASRLAHDIRNPLSVIQMTSDILSSDSEISGKFQKYASSINESIHRISHQVNNVLDYVQQKPLKLTKIAVSAIVDSALESINIPKNITIEKITTDDEIVCDHHMVRVAFINIITNAVYAIGSKIGKVRIEVRPDHDTVKIEISNTGESIPKKSLEKIFEPLFTTKQEGTGLGLASCKSIIDQHGGTISVKNNPTTFTITLPRNQ